MRFLLSKLRIFLFFPIPYLSQPPLYKFNLIKKASMVKLNLLRVLSFTIGGAINGS